MTWHMAVSTVSYHTVLSRPLSVDAQHVHVWTAVTPPICSSCYVRLHYIYLVWCIHDHLVNGLINLNFRLLLNCFMDFCLNIVTIS